MTLRSENNGCDGCGIQTSLTDYSDKTFCSDCLDIAKAISERPELVSKICTLTRTGQSAKGNGETVCQPQPKQLPDVLDAVRFRTRDRDSNTWYVSVSELDGNPVEVFASTAFDRDQHLQSRISHLTTITRLISLILRHIFLHQPINLEKTLKQLNRSSRQRNDLPDMLTGVLAKYMEQEKKLKQGAAVEKEV